jgi:hypothetical protein
MKGRIFVLDIFTRYVVQTSDELSVHCMQRTNTNVEIGTEAAQFPEKEYINGIFVAVYDT